MVENNKNNIDNKIIEKSLLSKNSNNKIIKYLRFKAIIVFI